MKNLNTKKLGMISNKDDMDVFAEQAKALRINHFLYHEDLYVDTDLQYGLGRLEFHYEPMTGESTNVFYMTGYYSNRIENHDIDSFVDAVRTMLIG